MRWAYGVTTVPERMGDLLPRTLASLAKAGFDRPRLFIDGFQEVPKPDQFPHLEKTLRYPKIRTYGNWVLALAETYIRTPNANRYAIFQDDLVTYHNLREYLERSPYPDKGYLNLYTFPANLRLARTTKGWFQSNQLGMGAVGLVFSREAVQTLLFNSYTIERPTDPARGWRSIDGGIVSAMKKVGWKEYVHNPSLLQHTGAISSMGNPKQQLADSFKGEDFDALELLKCE